MARIFSHASYRRGGHIEKKRKIKEIKISSNIGENDYVTQSVRIDGWLRKNYIVKIELITKSRRLGNVEIINNLFNRLKRDLESMYEMDFKSRSSFNRISILIQNAVRKKI